MRTTTIRTPTGRVLRIRSLPIGQSFGRVGQVLAGNGRVIHETATYGRDAHDAAGAAATRWAERRA